MATRVQVIGAGGHAKVVIATLLDLGVEVTAVWDDAPSAPACLGVPVRGKVAEADPAIPAILAIGDNRARARLAGALALPWHVAVHPTAYVHATASLGPGTVVFAGAIVQPGAVIGAHAIINTAASIDHDCRLGDFVHVAPGVHLSGAVALDDGVLIGVGACAKPGARVGAWSVIGAGAAVVSAIPAEVTAVGVPARVK